MLNQIPQLGEELNEEQIAFMKTFTKSCRRSIIKMLPANAELLI